MSAQRARRQAWEGCWAGAVAALLCASTAALAADFVEPAVFASSNGLLDLLMIAQPQPVSSIVYVPPDSGVPLNPIGWVYQICPMSAALPGNQCPSGAPTVSDYGGVRLALQPGDALQIRLVNRLPALNPTKVNHSVVQMINNATQTPMIMQLVAVDGISIDVPPSTSLGTLVKLGGARFSVVACPSSAKPSVLSTPVCIDEFAMMPSSRAEVYVIYRDQSGNIVTPPAGASATLRQIGITTGAVGDQWPQIDLANVLFTQTDSSRIAAGALDVRGQARSVKQKGGILQAAVPYARPEPLPNGCKPLPPGHRRRIFFGLPDTGDPDIFGLGYEEVDENDAPVPGTEVPVTAFDPSANTLCIPLGPGETPVTETWELVNLATENHNFHIHQTRFSYADPADDTGILAACRTGGRFTWQGSGLRQIVGSVPR